MLSTVAPASSAALDDVRLVRLDGDEDVLLDEPLDHRDEARDLRRRVDPRRAHRARLGADVDDVRALGRHDRGLAHRRVGRDGDALAVGRVPGEVDRPHDHGTGVDVEGAIRDEQRAHPVVQIRGVRRGEVRQGGERDHLGSVGAAARDGLTTRRPGLRRCRGRG